MMTIIISQVLTMKKKKGERERPFDTQSEVKSSPTKMTNDGKIKK